MDDKTKVQLCKKLIKNFFDYSAGNEAAGWMGLVDAVDTVLNFEEGNDDNAE